MTTVLSGQEVEQRLDALPGWVRLRDRLLTTVVAPDFISAIRVLDAVAEQADQLNHHPDVDLRYNRLLFALTTHSAGGITEQDFALADRIDEVARRLGSQVESPAAQTLQLQVACRDPQQLIDFWGEALHLTRRDADAQVHLVDAAETLDLVLEHVDPPPPATDRVRLAVEVPLTAASERVGAALSSGGHLRDASHAPAWWVLADAEGNELQVHTDAAPARDEHGDT
jgi:4a-hydroxytetrahydrobiopterin dehydratase